MLRGAIAVFDSGVGGLSVVRALHQLLPHETISYLGDTARLPYGSKSPTVVRRYAAACASFLCGPSAPLPPKLLVVACNTASAHGLAYLKQSVGIPVIGVIEPGAALALQHSQTRRIGVLGTAGTIASQSYDHALHRLDPSAQVISQACPMFVPLAEENLGNHPATQLFVADYLAPVLAARIDSLILGCTHYPLLRPALAAYVGPEVHIVDSAHAVALAARDQLQASGQLADRRMGADRYFATDLSDRLLTTGQAFLGAALEQVEWVDIPTSPG
jgi:glutamate racemase